VVLLSLPLRGFDEHLSTARRFDRDPAQKSETQPERCTDCGVCNLYCPMDINIAESEYVNNPNCIHCGLCAQACPKPGAYCEERECEK